MKSSIRNIQNAAISLALLIALCGGSNSSLSFSEKYPSLDIPHQNLEDALVEFAISTNVELLYTRDLLKGKTSHNLLGRYRPSEALKIILRETGLEIEILNEKAFLLREIQSVITLFEEPQQDEFIEEILVSGFGLQNQRAVSLKREASVVVEFVVQDDIGKFPDYNIADSFRRLLGVGAIFDEDEGRFVVARGISSSHSVISIDGIPLATVNGFGETGRSVGLQAIPSIAVKRLEAIKTFTPNVDAGAVGSSLNLVTRSAFDSQDRQFFIDLSVSDHTYSDIPGDNSLESYDDDNLGGSISLMGSDSFGGLGQYGIAAAFSYNVRQRGESKTIQEGHQYFDESGRRLNSPADPAWNGVVSPGEYRWYLYTNRVERYGAHIKFEYQESERFYAALSGYYYSQSQGETRNGHTLSNFDGLLEQTSAAGRFNEAQGIVSYNFFTLDQQNIGSSLFAQLETGELSNLRINVGYSFADFEDGSPNAVFATPITDDLGFSYDSSSFISTYQLDNPDYFTTAENYELSEYALKQRRSEESIVDLKLDYLYNMLNDSEGFAYQLGLERRNLTRERDNSAKIYSSPGLLLQPLSAEIDFVPNHREEPFLFVDINRLSQQTTFQYNESASEILSLSEDFKFQESVTAAYIMAAYSNSNYRLISGLRYDNVDIETRSPVFNNGIFNQRKGSLHYESVLPSMAAIYYLGSHADVRVSFSETIGRPVPGDVIALEIRPDDAALINASQVVKPSNVGNYDVTFNYYLDNGLLSLGFFYKDISGNLFKSADVNSGATSTMHTSEATLKGVEFNIIKNEFDFLPYPFDKMGFSGNLTLMDGSLEYRDREGNLRSLDRLIEQSDKLANATLFYNWNNRYEFRLIYAFQSIYTHVFFPESPHLNREWKDYTQWDMHGRYNISRNFSVYFEARNITDNNRVLAEDEAGLAADVEFGRSFFFGVNFRL